jgi:transcriptional regulator with XRE-family HTH domain
MERKLNISAVSRRMDEIGLNRAAIARNLGVSRTIVSEWMDGAKFPRPDKLLRLARLLKLGYGDIVVADTLFEPVTAFRKKGNAVTRNHHIARARDMGHMLRPLVPCLPFELLSRPSSLIDPTPDYEYVQRAAQAVRSRLKHDRVPDFTDLVEFFHELHAVIVPELWGKKDTHENSLHIYLPDSMTTWVFFNLDSSVIDFKFWMAHELGHVKTPTLSGDDAEDFADRFAGALLFPYEKARSAHHDLSEIPGEKDKLSWILHKAEELLISPITILTQINAYAEHEGRETCTLQPLYPATTKIKKRYHTQSEALFGTARPLARNYITTTSRIFATPFFDCLKKHIRESGKNHNYIQRIMNIPAVDALEIHRALSDDAD